MIVPIPKGGDCKLADNYRGISLLDRLSKCFCRVIQNRLEEWAGQNKLIPESQFGFLKQRSVTDSLFTLSTLIHKWKQVKKPLYSIFVDFAKARSATSTCGSNSSRWASTRKYFDYSRVCILGLGAPLELATDTLQPLYEREG